MDTTEPEMDITALSEERLRLEREALAVERERLQAARIRAEEEAKLVHRQAHPFLVVSSVTLLALLCFAAGLLVGMTVTESRQQALREKRLARALSQLDDLSRVSTNGVPFAVPTNGVSGGAHRNVSVMVIQ